MREKKNYKPAPAIRGIMQCASHQQHQWFVKDLNPERKTVLCPVCGTNTDIHKGLQK